MRKVELRGLFRKDGVYFYIIDRYNFVMKKVTESYQETNLNIDIENEVKSALINLDYKETEIENAFREYEKNESSKSSKTPGEGGVPQILDFETLFKQSLIIINTDTR